jgi:hypothetical protein
VLSLKKIAKYYFSVNNRGNKNSIEALPKWSDTGPLGVADCRIPSLIKLESTVRALRSFNPVMVGLAY